MFFAADEAGVEDALELFLVEGGDLGRLDWVLQLHHRDSVIRSLIHITARHLTDLFIINNNLFLGVLGFWGFGVLGR